MAQVSAGGPLSPQQTQPCRPSELPAVISPAYKGCRPSNFLSCCHPAHSPLTLQSGEEPVTRCAHPVCRRPRQSPAPHSPGCSLEGQSLHLHTHAPQTPACVSRQIALFCGTSVVAAGTRAARSSPDCTRQAVFPGSRLDDSACWLQLVSGRRRVCPRELRKPDSPPRPTRPAALSCTRAVSYHPPTKHPPGPTHGPWLIESSRPGERNPRLTEAKSRRKDGPRSRQLHVLRCSPQQLQCCCLKKQITPLQRLSKGIKTYTLA